MIHKNCIPRPSITKNKKDPKAKNTNTFTFQFQSVSYKSSSSLRWVADAPAAFFFRPGLFGMTSRAYSIQWLRYNATKVKNTGRSDRSRSYFTCSRCRRSANAESSCVQPLESRPKISWSWHKAAAAIEKICLPVYGLCCSSMALVAWTDEPEEIRTPCSYLDCSSQNRFALDFENRFQMGSQKNVKIEKTTFVML